MTSMPKLGHTLDRYNQGCAFFRQAMDAWREGDLPRYETSLRKAATEAVGALEWMLKIYLRNVSRPRLTQEDFAKLKNPNFNELMELMTTYAQPPLKADTISHLYSYRDALRNAAEHDASVPPSHELADAIQTIRELMLTYLPVAPDQLKEAGEVIGPESLLSESRAQYFEALRSGLEYMDLGGISPRIGGKVVKIRMRDLFIPLRAIEEQPLLESFSEEPFRPTFESMVDEASDDLDEADVTDASQGATQVVDSVVQGQAKRANIGMVRILSKPRVVILGHPGAGKTTVGKYIAYSIAAGISPIGKYLAQFTPVLIRAAEYALALNDDASLSLFNYIIHKHSTKFGGLFESALLQGSCIAIVDGLDEIPDARLRVITARRIEQFVAEFSNNRFLVTSRIVGYRQNQLAGDFTHVTLSELNSGQIRQFLGLWYTAIDSETESNVSEEEVKRKATELERAIRSNSGIRKLAGNPLLLTIIALAQWRGTKLPDRRVELYQIATETLIENWPLKQRGLTFKFQEMMAILEPIAYHILSSGKSNLITDYELRPLFEAQVCEVRGTSLSEAKALSRELLQTIEEHTGFFLLRGLDPHGQNMYGFLHLTFTEYLAARYLAEQWSSNEIDLARYVHDPHWHEVLLLMAGHIGTWATGQATRLVSQILELGSAYEEYLHRDLLRAAEVLGDNVRVKRELQDDIVSRLITLSLSSSHLPLWYSAARRLAGVARVFSLGNPSTQLQIVSSDPFEMQVRKAVILALTGSGTNENLGLLLQGLTQSRETQALVQLFIYSDGLFDGPGSELCWISIEHDASEPVDAFYSSSTIAKETASKIIEIGSATQDYRRWRGNTGLVTLGSWKFYIVYPADLGPPTPNAASLLVDAEDWALQALLAHALHSILSQEDIVSTFHDLLSIAIEAESTGRSVSALGAAMQWITAGSSPAQTRTEEVMISKYIGQLRALLDPKHDLPVRLRVLELLTLARSKREQIEEVLAQTLDDRDELVQLAALELALELDNDISTFALTRIRELARGASINVRRASLRVLAKMDKLGDGDVNAFANDVIVHPPTIADAPNFRTWLEDLRVLSSAARWTDTAAALRDLGRRLVENAAIDDTIEGPFYWYDFWEYSEYSRLQPHKDLAEAAVELFNSPNALTRYWAVVAWSLWRLPSTSSTAVLSLINDSDPRVRTAAIRSVRDAENLQPDTIDRLIQCLNDTDDAIVRAASSILQRVREPSTRQRIARAVAPMLTQAAGNEAAFGVMWALEASDDVSELG